LLRGLAWLKVLVLGILACGVLFSYSRAAWASLAVGLVVVLVVAALRPGGRRRAMLVLLTAFGAGVAVLTAVLATGSLGFLLMRAQLQYYDGARFSAQALGVRLGGRHLIGIGPGQFEFVAPISAHSTYVRVLAEQGIPGFLALLGLLAGTLWLAWRNAVAGVSTYGVGPAVLLGMWAALLVNSLVVDTLHWRHLWLVAGLIWAEAAARHDVRDQRSPRDGGACPT
jgi:O-antigen ligase